jgi:amidohydrolase
MSPQAHRLRQLAREAAPSAVELRRDLHRHPEIGWTERRSTYRVAEVLRSLGLDPQVRQDGVGLTVEIGRGDSTVGFRADLDGLPVEEENAAPYRSQVPGVMHACGHDAHTAIAVGIAHVLTRLPELPGSIRLVFQPAEEQLPSGAIAVCDEGATVGVRSFLAFHVDPALEAGRVGLRVGPITSASDKLSIELRGPGGHTSRPHRTVDLINVAARVVTDLPVRLREVVDPRHTMVMVFGKIAGGTADNAIPTTVSMGGTVRVLDTDLWRSLPKLVDQALGEIVTPFGATATLDYHQGAPPVNNHRDVIESVREAAVETLGRDSVVPTHQSLGSEDFSWFIQDLPGAMIRLGAALPDRTVDLHSATFDIDESAIETGVLVGTAALLRMLEPDAPVESISDRGSGPD